METKYYYIYNIQQANFLLQSGCIPSQMGLGKQNDIFIKFMKTVKLDEALTKWSQNKQK